MVGRSLLGVCNTETHCSVPLAPSCGISSGSLSLWMARHFQTRQVANHGTSQHALALQTVLQVHVASHCVLMLYTICIKLSMLAALAPSHTRLALPLTCLLSSDDLHRQQCSCQKLCFCRYDTYLFFGANKQKEMSYVAHLGAVSKVFDKLDILSGKKTHAMRGSGARDSSDSG